MAGVTNTVVEFVDEAYYTPHIAYSVLKDESLLQVDYGEAAFNSLFAGTMTFATCYGNIKIQKWIKKQTAGADVETHGTGKTNGSETEYVKLDSVDQENLSENQKIYGSGTKEYAFPDIEELDIGKTANDQNSGPVYTNKVLVRDDIFSNDLYNKIKLGGENGRNPAQVVADEVRSLPKK